MRQVSVALLFSLLLLPSIWNSITLFHYLLAHTHTLCGNNSDHLHSSPTDCSSIFQLTDSQSELPSHTQNEFQELQQYLSPSLNFSPAFFLSYQQTYFITPFLLDKSFSKDIFYPPIFA